MKLTKIGEILREADLISEGQLQTILYDQNIYPELKFGEVLELRGWISQRTVEFFIRYFQLKNNKPLGKTLHEYLLDSELITHDDLQAISALQQLQRTSFGNAAVSRGHLSQKTLNFFLRHFFEYEAQSRKFRRVTPAQEAKTVLRSRTSASQVRNS